MLRNSAPRLVAAIAAVTLIGVPTLNADPAAASTPSVPGTQLRAVPLTPIVAGPAPLHPTLVPAAPRRSSSSGSLHAFSSTSTFIVNYDAGFNANPAAKAAFQFAVDQWSNVISSPVPIVVDAQFSPLDPGVLGSAGPHNVASNFTGRPIADTWYPIALANALHGSDLDVSGGDIDASFSSSFSGFYFGTDGQTAGKYDFASVVLHELGHGLGFLGAYIVTNGTGSVCCGLPSPLAYDRFTSSNGQALDQIATPSVALGNALTSQAVQFSGPQTLGAGLGPAQLFAPAGWQSGSSYSHLDETVYGAGNPNSLMTPAIGPNEVIHAPGPLTLGILADTGWTLSNQPTLSVASARIVEGNADLRSMRFNVSLSSPSATAVSFNYETRPGTASSPVDFAGRTGTGTLPAGTTSTTVNIAVKGDTTIEAMEKFQLHVFGQSNANLGASTASGYILDDDASSDPRFGIGNASIVEGNSGVRKVRLSITLSKKHTAAVSVQWATGTGTAVAGSDYSAANGTVSIAAGRTDAVVNIDILPDSTSETNDYFRVTLSNPVGAGIQRGVGVVTVNNDD